MCEEHRNTCIDSYISFSFYFPSYQPVIPLLLEVGQGKENASGSIVHQEFLIHCVTSLAAVLATAIISEPKIEHLESELE